MLLTWPNPICRAQSSEVLEDPYSPQVSVRGSLSIFFAVQLLLQLHRMAIMTPHAARRILSGRRRRDSESTGNYLRCPLTLVAFFPVERNGTAALDVFSVKRYHAVSSSCPFLSMIETLPASKSGRYLL